MKFETEDKVVYCKDNSYNEDWFYYNNPKRYWNGYLVHREDGPAVEWCDGDKEWFLEGKHHREGGPAVEYSNGDKYWYLNGKEYSKKEYWKIMNLMNKNRVLNEI